MINTNTNTINEKDVKTKKILIVDSNKDLCTMFTNYLIKCGHDCVCAVDQRNGLSLIQKQKFDLILLNLQDSGFNGYDVIDALEKDEKLKENKIFVWTTLDLSQPEIDDLLKRGVRSYIKKPVRVDVLLRTLDAPCQE